MIFTYAIAPYDDWHRQAWAAGLVLLGLILVINIVAGRFFPGALRFRVLTYARFGEASFDREHTSIATSPARETSAALSMRIDHFQGQLLLRQQADSLRYQHGYRHQQGHLSHCPSAVASPPCAP